MSQIDYGTVLADKLGKMAKQIFEANRDQSTYKFSILITPVGVSVMVNQEYIGGVVSINENSLESGIMFLDAISKKVKEMVDDLRNW